MMLYTFGTVVMDAGFHRIYSILLIGKSTARVYLLVQDALEVFHGSIV